LTGSEAPAIDAELVARLIRAQFPHWSHLPIAPVLPGGWDNRTFRLGEAMLVRLPSAAVYAPQVEKEQRWLPILAPNLPFTIPQPVGRGEPGAGYRWPWSIYRWLPGETMESATTRDSTILARSIAEFLKALHAIPSQSGPPPGLHNFYRGGPLSHYDGEVRAALAKLGHRVDAPGLLSLWGRATASQWRAHPVWLHGDLSPGNVLIQNGKVSAIIDFGSCGVGDPACDLAIAWSGLERSARAAFRHSLPLDPDTWERGRGWALWKALITLAAGDPHRATPAARTLAELLA
jgi:aminoglycoside phosphotransferase (APT) family kinase protein